MDQLEVKKLSAELTRELRKQLESNFLGKTNSEDVRSVVQSFLNTFIQSKIDDGTITIKMPVVEVTVPKENPALVGIAFFDPDTGQPVNIQEYFARGKS